MLLREKACRNCCYRILCSDKGQFVNEITSDTIQVKCSLQKSPGIFTYDAETLTINHMMENCQVAIILTHKLHFFFYFLSFLHSYPSDMEGRLFKGWQKT